MMRCVQLEIYGRVQGVGFRYFVQRKAKALGLSGWVRNRADGSVQALVQGEDGKVEELMEACRFGPSSAVVEDVFAEEHPIQALAGFTIR